MLILKEATACNLPRRGMQHSRFWQALGGGIGCQQSHEAGNLILIDTPVLIDTPGFANCSRFTRFSNGPGQGVHSDLSRKLF